MGVPAMFVTDNEIAFAQELDVQTDLLYSTEKDLSRSELTFMRRSVMW
jgi:hypothetical protein